MARISPKRKLKRQPPPRNRGGVNPLLVALGAGAGAAAGRAATGTLSRRNITRRAADMVEADLESKYATRGRSAEEVSRQAAGYVADEEYRKMPRANKAKLANFRGMASERVVEPGKYDRARRNSGLSKKDTQRFYDKAGSKTEIDAGKRRQDGGQSLIEEATMQRSNRTRGRNTRRGAAAGGALATLAQLVAMELRKKK